MIVAGPEGLRKNQYRKFNIRSAELTPGDDFGMMREVLQRRFKRLRTRRRALAFRASQPPIAGADRNRFRPAGHGPAGDARRRRCRSRDRAAAVAGAR